MNATELNELLEIIENSILGRAHRTIHYLYIHMMGKIRMDDGSDLIASDAKTLSLLLRDESRTSPTDEICRKALVENVYPVIPSDQLAEIEERLIASTWPRHYPMKEQLQRAHDSGYL